MADYRLEDGCYPNHKPSLSSCNKHEEWLSRYHPIHMVSRGDNVKQWLDWPQSITVEKWEVNNRGEMRFIEKKKYASP